MMSIQIVIACTVTMRLLALTITLICLRWGIEQ